MHLRTVGQGLDELTGLAGYDRFLKDFEAIVGDANSQGLSASIALVDIDWFGKVNAEYGEAVGDRAIFSLGEALAESTGDAGSVYRYGGDAFMVLFDGLEKEQAFLLAEESRKRFEGEHVVERDEGAVRLTMTVSIGVTACPDDGSKVPELIRKCSEALYRAKVSGRNKVALAREEKMVTKTSHYTQGQLEGLTRLAKREGLSEATLLREALDDLLRKRNS